MIKPIKIWGDACHVSLIPYPAADTVTGPHPAMVICPGGAYREHAEHEGHGYAEWLNQHGITCFVLAYRLGSQGHRYPEPFEDVLRAMRFVRSNAASWNIDPQRIGVMGSSAGGHLAATLLTHFDHGNPSSNIPLEHESSRPVLGILCYPVISMETDAHSVSRHNLLGSSPSPDLVRSLSNEQQVTSSTPPCFIWHTFADASVRVSHSLAFAKALADAGVPFELHVYQTGKHGMGLNTEHPWGASCISWLKIQHFI